MKFEDLLVLFLCFLLVVTGLVAFVLICLVPFAVVGAGAGLVIWLIKWIAF